MTVKTLVKKSEYHDSVTLMLVARELTKFPGVIDVGVIMATEANKALLKESGLLTPDAQSATPNDLVIVVSANDDAAEAALLEAERLLKQKRSADEGAEFRPKTLRGAVKMNPNANVAVISVAGRYAADEAWDALRRGLHVLLFSDNVALEDEIALKRYARDHGLLLMGPGAGTAILNGVALGFANVVPSGPVGIVSAAGTGLQEVSTLLAKYGVGITQGIGTGGRDLKDEVGGIMMLEGLKALQADPATKVIALVSKPPSPGVAEAILDQVAQSDKPAIIGFMGANPDQFRAIPNTTMARTLQETALLADNAAGVNIDVAAVIAQEETKLQTQVKELRAVLKPEQKYLRGLFSGGTLCFEAQVIWRDLLKESVLSNAPLRHENQLADSLHSVKHTCIDLGEEEFTVGRPHPMIDNDLRIRRLLQEARDPEMAAIMLDVVIGYGAHPDPASELASAIQKAKRLADRELIVIASVTGTEQDPQRLSAQGAALKAAGAIVCESNAAAAKLVAMLVG
ncbi:MAG TPA: acyl-CoA synthetase FdrA [Anaerolineae bacterium]|nr:acyl-CoA synthetase FdrA [Anaerolineae bacterium]